MEVIMPQLGETVTEGTVINWYKKVGDAVKADEPLFDVETEKVTTEIPSPMNGVLKEIRVETGVAVPVGTVLAVIEAGAAAVKPVAAAPAPAPAASKPAAAPDDELVPLSRIRQQTAAHLVQSIATSAHVLQTVEVDYERVDQFCKAKGEQWKAKESFSLTYLPFIARAVCAA